MRLHRIEIDNFMALRAVNITPQGNIIQITGRNGAGKSAVINAIFAALCGKKALPADPVRHGEQEARITLDLGTIIVRLKIDVDGSTKLLVESVDGAYFKSPQALLDKLIGARTFDPLAFTRMDAKAQRNHLAALVGLTDMLSQLAAEHAADYENRTSINRRLKEQEAKLSLLPADVVVEPIDVTDVMQQIRDAREHNHAVDKAHQWRQKLEKDAANFANDAGSYREEAARLLDKADACDAAAEVARKHLAELLEPPAMIDVAALEQRIVDAQSVNERARKQQERAVLVEKVKELKAESDALTERMKERELEKARVVAATPMPIAELGLTEDGVTYQGVPFEQASSAEQIRVSASIAMAMNPELRMMTIRDGSLLDSASMAILEELAETHDFQVLIECVRDDDSVGIVISDGSVVKVNEAVAA